jgi:putative DNA primase/helicase
MARCDPQVAVAASYWNRDPWLLGTPDGTVDLRTGAIHPADPVDGISKITSVVPADKAECPRWLAFLQEAMKGDAAKIRFLQQWSGYTLTGTTLEQKLIFCWGEGGNGKGVYIATIGGLLGPYKREASMDTFTATRSDRHPTDLAHLYGARMVTAAETTQGRAWDEARIKQLTGGDIIAARFMRQDFFEFAPTFKLTVIGNYKPVLKSVDDAIRRRFLILPFTNKPPIVDTFLVEKLQAEWPAILRWAIDGALDWQRNGLVVPDSVLAATSAYFEGQDVFSDWLAEACQAEVGNDWLKGKPSELFASWSEFAKRSNLDPGSLVSFGDTLESRGFPRNRNNAEGRYHEGIRLKSPSRYQD